MNPEAILTLISQLTEQAFSLAAENDRLRERLAELAPDEAVDNGANRERDFVARR